MPRVFGSSAGEGWKGSAGSAPAAGRGRGKGNSRFRCYRGRSPLLLTSQVAVCGARAAVRRAASCGGAGGAGGAAGRGGCVRGSVCAALTRGASENKTGCVSVNSVERDVKPARPASSSPEPSLARKLSQFRPCCGPWKEHFPTLSREILWRK